VDNLLSVDLVSAEGELLTVSENQQPDLFWGVRGGGGNFGIVTSFEYRLHPVGPLVLAGPVFYPLERAPQVLRLYREFVASAPDDLTTIVNLRAAPAVPFLPQEVHGQPIVMIGACYAGPPQEGIEIVRPLKQLGRPIVDLLQPRPYRELQSMFDASVPHGWHYYHKALEMPSLTTDVVDALVEHTATASSPKSYTIIFQLGGALARVPEHTTAFNQRRAAHNLNINAVWTEHDPDPDQHIAWARNFFRAIRPHAASSVYVNFLHDDEPDRVRDAYGTHNYTRLVELKRAHDPTNFFHHNHNINPQ
jgi:FAD/FMN-containing dehydrogenase